MRRISRLSLAAVLFAFCACARAALVDGIEAVVSDALVTSQQIDIITRPDVDIAAQQYQNDFARYQKEAGALRSSAFTNLIEKQLILSYFKSLTNKINETILDQIVADRIKEAHSDRVQLIKDLQREGLTFEDYRQRVRENLIIGELIRENVPEPVISPLKIETYYHDHQDGFKVEDQIKMRMIVLNKSDAPEETKRRAYEILSQIKEGASFAQMASLYSQGSQRADGGETGWEDLSVVNESLRKEIEKLKPGQCSGLIDTTDTFFIVLLEDRHPAHVKKLEEVRDTIEKTLKTSEAERLRRKWVERLRHKTYIGYF